MSMTSERIDEQGRPVRVKVGAVDYTVQWHGLEWHRQTGAMGQQDMILLTIDLYEALAPHQIAVTFMHEIVHALHLHSLNDGNLNGEEIAALVSVGLTAFWRDNPLAFYWWRGLLTAGEAA